MGIIVGRIGVAEIEAGAADTHAYGCYERGGHSRTGADSSTLGILGAGGEAKYHLLAFPRSTV
jgi:hypothetical protein